MGETESEGGQVLLQDVNYEGETCNRFRQVENGYFKVQFSQVWEFYFHLIETPKPFKGP